MAALLRHRALLPAGADRPIGTLSESQQAAMRAMPSVSVMCLETKTKSTNGPLRPIFLSQGPGYQLVIFGHQGILRRIVSDRCDDAIATFRDGPDCDRVLPRAPMPSDPATAWITSGTRIVAVDLIWRDKAPCRLDLGRATAGDRAQR